jgi:hypothetical protein
VHKLSRSTTSHTIRLWIDETNGGPRAEVAEIRVYAL